MRVTEFMPGLCHFSGTVKWIPGVIESVLCPLTYRIIMKDNRIWKRHQDHVKLRYTEDPTELDESETLGDHSLSDSSIVPKMPEQVIPYDTQRQNVSDVEQPQVIESPTHAVKPTYGLSPHKPVICRSERIRHKPDKLNLKISD